MLSETRKPNTEPYSPLRIQTYPNTFFASSKIPADKCLKQTSRLQISTSFSTEQELQDRIFELEKQLEEKDSDLVLAGKLGEGLLIKVEELQKRIQSQTVNDKLFSPSRYPHYPHDDLAEPHVYASTPVKRQGLSSITTPKTPRSPFRKNIFWQDEIQADKENTESLLQQWQLKYEQLELAYDELQKDLRRQGRILSCLNTLSLH